MRPIAIFFLALALHACTTLERQFLPSARLADAHWAQHGEAEWRTVDHSAWTEFLQRYVSTDMRGVNRVDYAAVTDADRAALERYIARLERMRVSRLTRPEQLAVWVNLYNALTVDLVLEHYPVDSIRAIDPTGALLSIGPWDTVLVTIEERPLSLNDIEHRIIRPVWKDSRIHYVLNCAAAGCPNLAKEAYRGSDIDARMSAAAEAYVNDPRGVRFTADGRLVVSKIYSWFVEDFGGSEREVLAHLRQHAAADLRERLADRTEIGDYEYDWSLNDARRAGAPVASRLGPHRRPPASVP